MWSEIPYNARDVIIKGISDYKMIEHFTPEESSSMFKNNLKFIENSISPSCRNIVLTHHSPIFEYHDVFSHAFCSRCDRVLKKVDVWLFGHTHKNVIVGNAMSNCMGYRYNKTTGFYMKFLEL